MLSRRGFLIGTGGLLTTAFMKDARAFIRRKEVPLLAAPPRTAHTLYWDWPDGLDEPQLFLDDEPEVIAPEPPTWRVFLNSMVDAKDYTATEIKLRLEQLGFERGQLDEEMDESWWEIHYDRISGPSAKAYRLLDNIDLGPDHRPRATALISSSWRAAAISSIIRSTRMRATCSRFHSCRPD